ncbi:hypothetical protein [Enterococcus diestrammenae]|uniref:hypothetical protein n=1 Tax=Enterococcus diestrammenae TaxID=1155073 RepID=UPI00195B998A
MKEFEQAFKDELKDEQPITEGTRIAIDQTYAKILSSQPKYKPIMKQTKMIMIAIVVLSLGVLGSLTFSPLSDAFSKLLSLGNFTSQSLLDSNFVNPQSGIANSSSVKISLDEIYADQNQIGLHLTATLPDKSLLLSKEMDDYSLKFALVNGDGTVVADINSGLGEDDLLGTVSYQVNPDRDENLIEFAYQLTAKEDGTLPSLKNARIKVIQISANQREIKPGKSQNKIQKIDGTWSIDIKSDDIRQFEPVQYVSDPSAMNKLDVVSAVAYPSSFIIYIKNNDKLEQYFESDFDDSIPMIHVQKNDRSYSYRLLQASSESEDTLYKLRFEYGGYDEFSNISVSLPSGDRIELVRK